MVSVGVVVLLIMIISSTIIVSRTVDAAIRATPQAVTAVLSAGTATISWEQTSTAGGVILARIDPANTLTIIALRPWMPYEDPQQRTLIDDQQPMIGDVYYLIETGGVPLYDPMSQAMTTIAGVYGPYDLTVSKEVPEDSTTPARRDLAAGSAELDTAITHGRDGSRIAWTQTSDARGALVLGVADSRRGEVIALTRWERNQQNGLHEVRSHRQYAGYYVVEWWADMPDDGMAYLGDSVQIWGSYGPYRDVAEGPDGAVVYLPLMISHAGGEVQDAENVDWRNSSGYPAPSR